VPLPKGQELVYAVIACGAMTIILGGWVAILGSLILHAIGWLN
jgi:hypothetical protein